MQNKPCKLHLTLLDVIARCPCCGWPAGDHPTHPSNREPRLYNEASDLRKELAELRLHHRMLASVFALFLQEETGSASLSYPREAVSDVGGEMTLTIEDEYVGLLFSPDHEE